MNKESRDDSVLFGNGSACLSVLIATPTPVQFYCKLKFLADLLQLGVKLSDLLLQPQRKVFCYIVTHLKK